MDTASIMQYIDSSVWGVWFLMGAMLVFFMQCGFAMVESGVTRAKNAGKIIMKNLMDFCIGTIMFVLLGYGLMNSAQHNGFIGLPDWGMLTDFFHFDWSGFFFQLVFCATAATIVSGAMAERTKFISYCVYSGVLSLLVYPIEAGWAWNSQGWLSKLGFVDFAGSCVIHMVGGVSALVGAAILGPRIGKYFVDHDGNRKSRAIPGHSLTLGALGCFILWFAWYGFNGAAATNVTQLSRVLSTTTIAPAVATVVCMIFTWVKNGKPDVSMCLNASLAGLVAITAPCSSVDAIGATIIGMVAGVLVVVVVEFIDLKLHIDDPVGAVAVHGANGLWGTLAVGLFDCGSYWEDGVARGLFYGGGVHQLLIQLLGILTVGCYTAVVMVLVFTVIKKTVGLRASAEDEVNGLDLAEHGLHSAYADFTVHDSVPVDLSDLQEGVAQTGEVPAHLSVPVKQVTQTEPVTPMETMVTSGAHYGAYTKISILCNQNRFEQLKANLTQIGITGMTVTQVMGCGAQKGRTEFYRGVAMTMHLLPKLKIDIVVSKVPVDLVVSTTRKTLYTGHFGDGKIFIYNVENVIRIRTGEEGVAALQDPEE